MDPVQLEIMCAALTTATSFEAYQKTFGTDPSKDNPSCMVDLYVAFWNKIQDLSAHLSAATDMPAEQRALQQDFQLFLQTIWHRYGFLAKSNQ